METTSDEMGIHTDAMGEPDTPLAARGGRHRLDRQFGLFHSPRPCLTPRSDLPEGVYGEAWQVHGGGFYRIMKYLVAPAKMPDELTWFKWEAYATWLSGFALTPKGILLDAPDHIPPNARLIGRNAAWSNAMPPKNVTEMTGEERALIAAWLAIDRR
jgi:uncharacterized membrane protein